MKTPEDEAFDELARKQGAWGGGFQSKRKMAADKLQEPVCNKDPQGCWNVRCQLGKQCKNLAQPAQEPEAWGFRSADGSIYDCISPKAHDECEGEYNVPLYTTPPQRPWVGLTDEEIKGLWTSRVSWTNNNFARAIEQLLKEKNNG